MGPDGSALLLFACNKVVLSLVEAQTNIFHNLGIPLTHISRMEFPSLSYYRFEVLLSGIFHVYLNV